MNVLTEATQFSFDLQDKVPVFIKQITQNSFIMKVRYYAHSFFIVLTVL
jgi:hypothetical protein